MFSWLETEQARKAREVGQFVVGAVGRVTGLAVAIDPDAVPPQTAGRHDVVFEPLRDVEDVGRIGPELAQGIGEDDGRGFVGSRLLGGDDRSIGTPMLPTLRAMRSSSLLVMMASLMPAARSRSSAGGTLGNGPQVGTAETSASASSSR